MQFLVQPPYQSYAQHLILFLFFTFQRERKYKKANKIMNIIILQGSSPLTLFIITTKRGGLKLYILQIKILCLVVPFPRLASTAMAVGVTPPGSTKGVHVVRSYGHGFTSSYNMYIPLSVTGTSMKSFSDISL